MNRLIGVTTPGGAADVSTSYTLDGLPEVITAANPGGVSVVTRYSYNKRRLLTAERSENGASIYTLAYGYTANGHLSKVTYPDLQEVQYAPDALGRASQVRSASGETYASGIGYFPNGAIAQFTYGNGLVHRMTQNVRQLAARSQDLQVDASGNIVARILDDSYSFDANGNVLDITDQARNGLTTRGMSYDGLDRLKTAVSPNQWGNASYNYDALDNLTAANLGARQFRYSYDSATNRLATIRSPSGALGFSFSHDVRGNVSAKTVGAGCGSDTSLQCAGAASLALVFDSANRLNQVTNSQTYRYDGLGRRVQTTDAGTNAATYWIYSQAGQVLYSTEARRTRNIAYIYLGNTQVATRTVTWGSGAVEVRYQHTDALGSPVAETDGNMAVTKRNSFSPWGETWGTTSVDGTGYTGHVTDQGTGLIYMQQRYYDPVVGRFLSSDPVPTDPNSGANFNSYWYANNNPIRFLDPDGRLGQSGAAGWNSHLCDIGSCESGSFGTESAAGPSVRSVGPVGSPTSSTPGSHVRFGDLAKHYPAGHDPYQVMDDIGGAVAKNSKKNGGKFENTCSIRLCRALNKSGARIPSISGKSVTGGDGNNYIYTVKAMERYLTGQFGTPSESFLQGGGRDAAAFNGRTGIILFDFGGGNGYTGHVDLWNGLGCVGNCGSNYLTDSPRVLFWDVPK
jgi:RHS repeat-associated protein